MGIEECRAVDGEAQLVHFGDQRFVELLIGSGLLSAKASAQELLHIRGVIV
jgi:hypothetical protein